MSVLPRIALLVTVLFTANVQAGDLPRSAPEEAGFSSQRLKQMDSFFAAEVGKGDLAGIVTLIARHGKIVHLGVVGYADLEHETRMREDTIFRLYSMTKPIASVALMMLYEQGRFQMTDPVSKYIPEFTKLRVLRTPAAALNDTVEMEHPPTIEDLFRHTAGFTGGRGTDPVDVQYTKQNVVGLDVTLEDMMTKLATIPLKHQPGTTFDYSVGPDVIARLVEVISGLPFDEFLEKRMFRPLGMKDAGFRVPADNAQRLAVVYWMKEGKLTPLDEIHGHPDAGILVPPSLVQPSSVNSYTLEHKHKGGSAGLVSTIEDYWRFAQMMLNGGALEGTRLLSPHTVRYVTQDHLGKLPSFAPGVGWGLGFAVVKDAREIGYISNDGNYYWGGAAATNFWIDPKNDMVVIAMTQHLSVPAALALPSELNAMIYGALMQ